MRLFIAVKVPDFIEAELLDIQKSLEFAKLRNVKSLHLTLKFIGETPSNKFSSLKTGLKDVKFDRFKASLKPLGVFPNLRRPRVVWVGVSDNGFTSLQRQIEDITKELGFKKSRRFKPHITLARVKYVKDKQEFANKIKTIKVKPLEFEVDKFELIKSTLTSKGPLYDVLESYSCQQRYIN